MRKLTIRLQNRKKLIHLTTENLLKWNRRQKSRPQACIQIGSKSFFFVGGNWKIHIIMDHMSIQENLCLLQKRRGIRRQDLPSQCRITH
jgi:hypothetical protein